MKKQLKMAILVITAMIGGVSAQNMDSREGDSLALVAIKKVNDMNYSYDRTHNPRDFWPLTERIDTWSGVGVNSETGRVESLKFVKTWVEYTYYYGDPVLSQLPAEIGNLKELKSLTIENEKITSIPAEVGKLTNLTSLSLEDNQLTTLPTEIMKLVKLDCDSFTISNNAFSADQPNSLKTWLDTYDSDWATTQKASTPIISTKSAIKSTSLTAIFDGTSLSFSAELPFGTSVNIFDLTGRQIFTGLVTGSSLYVGPLATGVYITRIGRGTALMSMKLIVR